MESNNEMVAVQKEAEQDVCMDNEAGLDYIAVVVNCALECKGKFRKE